MSGKHRSFQHQIHVDTRRNSGILGPRAGARIRPLDIRTVPGDLMPQVWKRMIAVTDVRRDTIDEELVRTVVHLFYGKVRTDPLLGPIFEGRIGPDWDAHLQHLTLFWSALAFKNGAYSGNPHKAHQGLALTEEHFQRWLHLFEDTLRQTCRGDATEFFRDRAHRIADSLQIGLGIGPKALRLS